MSQNKQVIEDDLAKINGGTRPEEVGEQRMISPGVVSYEICENCGACMFPSYKRWVNGTEVKLVRPDYVCSECDNVHHVTQVFAN